jgi:hypothetical protein
MNAKWHSTLFDSTLTVLSSTFAPAWYKKGGLNLLGQYMMVYENFVEGML